MQTACQRTLHALREQGTATRPALAAITELSVVSVDKALKELCRRGLAEKVGPAASGGGRPALLYRYCTERAQLCHIRFREDGRNLRGRIDFTDLGGKLLNRQEVSFAYLEEQALDSWLDDAAAGRPLVGIVLMAHPALPPLLNEHLKKRYACGVKTVNLAEALADERNEHLTLVLQPGQAPHCAMRKNGILTSCGNLELLPLPARWEALDYSDHTLVEEMIARILLILTCTLAPRSCTLHATFWTPKLVQRIRFNTNAKLKGQSPTLHFRPAAPENTDSALRHFALKQIQ